MNKVYTIATPFAIPSSCVLCEESNMKLADQETLINTIRTHDTQITVLYTRLFLALPLLCTAPYLSTFYKFTSLLSITSLLSTAYLLYFVPLSPESQKQSSVAQLYDNARWREWFDEDGPVNKNILWLNAGLAGVVALMGYVRNRAGGAEALEWLWSGLPLGMLAFDTLTAQST
jgi:hypothetical protein